MVGIPGAGAGHLIAYLDTANIIRDFFHDAAQAVAQRHSAVQAVSDQIKGVFDADFLGCCQNLLDQVRAGFCLSNQAFLRNFKGCAFRTRADQ